MEIMETSNPMKTRIFDTVAAIVRKASGLDMNRVDLATDYISLGFDSLVVVRIDQGIRKQFNLEIDMGLYYEELDSLKKLLDYLADNLPQDWSAAPDCRSDLSVKPAPDHLRAVESPSAEVKYVQSLSSIVVDQHETATGEKCALQNPVKNMAGGALSGLERLLNSQMQTMSDLMHRQLDLLGAYGGNFSPSTRPAPSRELTVPHSSSAAATPPSTTSLTSSPATSFTSSPASNLSTPPKQEISDAPKPRMAEIRAMKFDPDRLNSSQQEFLDCFIPPYIARTEHSKAYARQYRPLLSDWINTLGFRRSIKEIVYPIVSARSAGARVWDIDGNEYLDLAMGYGVDLFGHSPSFVTEAIEEQLKIGFELGPQNHLVGEVATLIHDLTGMDRVAFCNTGSEAVMMALRAAQAVTGKERIALFIGSYHGNSDLVIKDTLLLRYGDESALTIIRENAHELAAVLVEPVQSRNPSLQPREFLHALRALTSELGVVLIFDEMINGFRCHPGGAQAVFGVRADMATYGKAPAGGMPIGIVAGSIECMRVIDGGLWDYGDESVPGQEVIFFGGTFCKHPLTMAAARAALLHMKSRGEALQAEINLRTQTFATAVNRFFEQENVGIRVSWFASQFIFEPTIQLYRQPVPPLDMTVWFHLLISKGIYTWERRACFFSEAHTDADVEHALKAIKESALELKAAGFPLFGGKEGGNGGSPCKNIDGLTREKIKDCSSKELKSLSRGGESEIDSSQQAEITIPLTQAQQQLWFLSQLNENAVPAYIETVAVRLTGTLDRDTLSVAAADLVARHSALRTVMTGDGRHQRILPTMPCTIHFTQARSIIMARDISTATPVPEAGDVSLHEEIDPLQIWLLENSAATFDLVKGPLFSFKLLQLEPQIHVLAMNFHHIVMDGRSVNVLLRDLIHFYTARVNGQNAIDIGSAPDLRAYQNWLEEYLTSADSTRDQEFWREVFPETIPMLDFPADRPRPSLFTFRGARHHLQADPELLGRALALGRTQRLTPFMTLISLYTLWMHKLTGREEVVIGFPVSGRFFPDSDDLVGYCTHLVPFVSQYDAEESFIDYMARSRKSLTAAYGHQKYPFGQLIRNLKFDQDLSRGSVIASEFNLDQMQVLPPLEGLTLSLVDIPLSYAKYDFNLEIMEVAGQYQFKFEYATDLFDPATIERMANHFMTLLSGVTAYPEKPLRQISLLTSAQRHQLLTQWNDTYRNFPLDQPFHRLFEAQVVLTPDRTAAAFYDPEQAGEEMTYKELNGHANRLAWQLIAAINDHLRRSSDSNLHHDPGTLPLNSGLFPDLASQPLIPILADRSCRFLVAMIAIFKAGCAYLPLDPDHPADRISGILKQAGAKFILAEKRFKPLLEAAMAERSEEEPSEADGITQANLSCQVDAPSKRALPTILWFEECICNSPLTPADERNLSDNPGVDLSEALAYVIFTSGSTGLPKGAMVQQKGMVNHLYAKIEDLGITADDVLAQNASQCFDISVWQFLAPLLKGGRVQIMSTEAAHDPALLVDIASKYGVTILELVPSLLRVLLEQLDSGGINHGRIKIDKVETIRRNASGVESNGMKSSTRVADLRGVRWLVPTGEALPPGLCTQWFSHYPGVSVLNAYGPTECSDDVAHYPLHKAPGQDIANIPIGKPVANMRLYVLDPNLEPVPIGVVGELWVGGVGVGLGYLNQPDLTGQAFSPDPFNLAPNARLYRTGDLAQFLPDGNILFLGRGDHQVKIRGFRIELGEIEAVLARHIAVKELVVTATTDASASIKVAASTKEPATLSEESAYMPKEPATQRQVSLTAYVVFKEDAYASKNREGNNYTQHKNQDSELIEELRHYLAERLPGYMVPAYFVPLERLPLTANGKIDRKALPDPSSIAIKSTVTFMAPRSENEQVVAEVLAGVLNRSEVGIHDNYFALGGDSIQAIQAVARIQAKGYILKLRDIFQYPTVAELAPRLKLRTRQIDQAAVTGPVPQTPIQAWLLSQDQRLINHYNQAVVLNFTSRLNVSSLKAALESLMIHHDALRLTVQAESPGAFDSSKADSKASDSKGLGSLFKVSDSGQLNELQLNIKGVELKPDLVVIPFKPGVDPEAIFSATSRKLNGAIDLLHGPLLKAALFQGQNQDRLLLVIHHLAVDAVSWPILIEDLLSAFSAHAKGEPIKLPAKTDSFQYWAKQLQEMVSKSGSEVVKAVNRGRSGFQIATEKEYWESLAKEPHMELPLDFPEKNGVHQQTDLLEITLPAPDTAILTGKAHMAFHTDMNDLILTALARGLRHWAAIDTILVSLEGHGRDPLVGDTDISRTVGWFTTTYPVLLKLPEQDSDLGLQIKQIKESLHQVPNRGASFGIIRPTLSNETLANLKPTISFNYLGAVDAERSDHSIESDRVKGSDLPNGSGSSDTQGTQGLTFTVEAAPHRELVHPQMERTYLLEIEAEVRKGTLHIQIYYCPEQYHAETVRRLGATLKDALIQIIDHCSACRFPEVTPSDLTWPHLSLPEFETVLNDHGVTPAEVQDIYPLTPMQENMLFHRLYSADSTAYFEQFCFTLKGDLNLTWFEQAWNQVSLRHDILRTSFIYKGVERPLQLVRRSRSIEWHYKDLSKSKNVTNKLEALKRADRQRGFELDRDILMRMHIFKLESGRYSAIWSYHHILMDGWCLGLLIQDVQSAYMALSQGEEPQFTPAPQYREYILWLEQADHAASLAYWSSSLDGFHPITPLPRDLKDAQNREEPLSEIQNLYSFELDGDLSHSLSEFSSKYQITINTLVQSVWGLMLAQANGVADVVFGAAVSGRPTEVPDVENVVGLFINTVPVRVRMTDGTLFGELARRVQAESLAAEPHHFVSLASIQTACGVETALLDHVLIFQNYPLGDELESLQKQYGAGFTLSDLEAVEQTGYDLSVEIYPLPNLHFDLRYNPAAYSTDRMDRVGRDLTTLFAAIAQKPDTAVGELKHLLASPDELGAEADFLAAAMNIDDDF